MLQIGSFIKIVSDNESYDDYRDKKWMVTHIARNRQEHQGYDETMGSMALVDCRDLPFSLYSYEFKIV